MRSLTALILFSAAIGCNKPQTKLPDLKAHDIHQVIEKMTDIMIHDVTNPPLAARFFSYACLAGYEVVSQNDSG